MKIKVINESSRSIPDEVINAIYIDKLSVEEIQTVADEYNLKMINYEQEVVKNSITNVIITFGNTSCN